MPSYKPKIQILLSEEYHKKFKALCEKDRRSDSVMGAIMIEKFINDYEKEHGEIVVENTKKENSTLIKAVKMATGVTTGEMLGDIAVEAIKKHRESKSDIDT